MKFLSLLFISLITLTSPSVSHATFEELLSYDFYSAAPEEVITLTKKIKAQRMSPAQRNWTDIKLGLTYLQISESPLDVDYVVESPMDSLYLSIDHLEEALGFLKRSLASNVNYPLYAFKTHPLL